MWLASLRRLVHGKSRSQQEAKKTRQPRRRTVPRLEHLEDRIVPSNNYTVAAGDTVGLINAINSANSDSASNITGDTITLTYSATNPYKFSSTNNTTNGANVLPVITAVGLTIEGNGSTLNAGLNSNLNAGSFGRLFDVASGASVTLVNMTLTGGLASGSTAQGGAVYDAGANLTMKTVTVVDNVAKGNGQTTGGAGNNAQGGGLYISGGTVNLTNCIITANDVYAASGVAGGAGGNAQGGGIYATAATLTLSGTGVNNSTVKAGNGGKGTSKHVTGGVGGASGLGQGGGVFIQGGSLILTNAASVKNNTIESSSGGQGGAGKNGPGGAGGAGGEEDGGGVFASGTITVSVENGAKINDNTLNGAGGGVGGSGASSKAGGAGGNGGNALGGGLYVQGGSVSISGADTEIDANTAIGGPGGQAGKGGANGGNGGEADGGGVYVLNAPISITGGTTLVLLPTRSTIGTTPMPGINANTATGGNGGGGSLNKKGISGTGGAGGAAEGGGVFISGTGQNVVLGDAANIADILGNTADAGKGGTGGRNINNFSGGNGGAGGNALGGGAAIFGDTLSATNTTFFDNTLYAGSGGAGGTSLNSNTGSSGNGGNAQGGGLYVSGSSGVSVVNSLFFGNTGYGGQGGLNLPTGLGGNAEGGGLYADNSTVNVLNSTFDVNLLAGGVAGSGATPHGGATEGGGLFGSGGSLTLVNATVAWNELSIAPYQGSPPASGGGVYTTLDSTLNLTNTVIALDEIITNPGPPATTNIVTYDDFDGTAAVNDHNLIGNNATDPNYEPGASQQLFVGDWTNNTSPGELYSGQYPADYGGLTYTLPLAWNTSPAISNGNPNATGIVGVSTDQRGLPRLVNGTIDIGATETQVMLGGSAPATTTAGATFTYTLTVINNESTAANVTLTDVLDNNTTYKSSDGGKTWSITAPTSPNGGTLTATATVAANSTATLTITVTVSSTVAAGTTLANTASIVPTGNSAAGTRSVTIDTTVPTAGKNDTTTSLQSSSSANRSVYGEPVTFTATVSVDSPGTGTPTGTVTFEDGTTILQTVNLTSGVATFTTSTLTVGNHSITAVYSGDINDNGSTSAVLTQEVDPDQTTTTLASSVNPSVFGQSVTFTATVAANSPGAGTPTGTVTFEDGNTALQTVDLSGGVATFNISTLSVGNHSITAVYSGDTNDNGSMSAVLTQEVDSDQTTTTLSSSVNPSVYGQSVTFTATVNVVSPGAGMPTGTVTFEDGTTILGTGNLSSGVATFATSSLTVGNHSITAVYGGDTNDAGSTSSILTQTVNQDVTSTGINVDHNPSVYGQSVTFTATVSTNSPGAGTPSGTVSFKDGSTTLGTGTLSGGVATFSTFALSVGNHSITAVYGGDTNDLGSTSNTLSQVVNQDSTTTMVSSSVNPSVYGQSVTFTATVSANSPGSGTPTGTVTFEDGTTILGTGQLSGGMATFSISTLSVGNHSITAVYGGDTNDAGSTSSTLTQTVNKDSTATALSSSVNPSVYGQGVTFTATVSANSPGAGTPTGTVTFEDGTTILGTGKLSGGAATFSTSALSVGNHNITAVYGGDANDAGSTSSTLTQTVNQDVTSTSISVDHNPSVYGQSVTFTATVSANSPGAGTPTGTVTFEDSTTILGTGNLSGGVATFTTSSLTVGTHSITAIYGGDANDLGSTSNTLNQVVNQDSTTTTLASSVNPSVFGQSVTFTATVSVVSPGAGTPTGTVTFEDGTTILGTGKLSGGVATFTASALSVGNHNITAVYGGDANDAGSTSSNLTQTVNQDGTTTSLTSSLNPSVSGQSVTFTATVSVVSPGAGTPSGTVTFEDGSTTLGTGTLSGGVATFTTSSLTVGSHTITAVYSGDANDLASSGTVTQQVNSPTYSLKFLPPLSNGLAFALNRTIPIKFTLTDANGNPITSLSAVTSLQIQQVDANGNPIGSPFTPASTNNQGLQSTGGQYLYNWQTKGLSAGYYEIEVTLADGSTHNITIQLTAHGSTAGLVTGSGGTATAGALLGGEVDVYVDNSNGDLTSDELARIQDAVNSIDAVITPYGVTIVEVTDPTQANVTLNMNTTCSLGGVAQGVLGCTTDADQVTMIQGWNWYAGSDPTQVGAGQYDFETAVMHELGHVLGLGHSTDSTSIMYPALATGTANRVLSTADLNVPDDDSGPCALHAAPAAVNATSNSQGMTTPSSTSIPSNGSSMSAADQLFANFTIVLNEMKSGNQPSSSSVSALWQSIDALVLQRLDALLSMEAGAMGISKDTLMLNLFFANKSNGV
ncbi:MAG TPA: Ig-like domain repeat protein [Gemmataceae bacterium]|nr:Ig-like domain repeat protein [Gemmataceae bacterium]